MSIFKKIFDWAEKRNLNQIKFNHEKETFFIIEELLESTGKYTSETAENKAQKISKEIIKNGTGTKEEVVDAFADIIVYATGTIIKSGYDPDKVMDEVLKELDSRTGKLINRKFVKNLNCKMYKANFSKCLLKKK